MLTIHFVKVMKQKLTTARILNELVPAETTINKEDKNESTNKREYSDCLLINDVLYTLPSSNDGTVFVVQWINRKTKNVLNKADRPYSVVNSIVLNHVRDKQLERGLRLFAVVFVSDSGLLAFSPGNVITDTGE